MDSLVHIQVTQETAYSLTGIMIVPIFEKVNLVFLDDPHGTSGTAVPTDRAHGQRARLDLGVLKDLGIGYGRVLDYLVSGA